MITEADVDEYRRIHFPESYERSRAFAAAGGLVFPFSVYVSLDDHAGFHRWFGRACDDTCPHLRFSRAPDAAPLPVARVVRSKP